MDQVENRRRNASAKVSFNSFHSIKTKYHLFFLPVLSSGSATPAHSEERHAPSERDGKNFFSFLCLDSPFSRQKDRHLAWKDRQKRAIQRKIQSVASNLNLVAGEVFSYYASGTDILTSGIS